MAFPPKLVVEQFTMMDAELFQKVVSSPCLGSTWGKRNKPGNEHQTLNVQATVDHEFEILKNFFSSCTVNSALQKTFTSHLKNTRGKFPARTLLLLLSSPHLQGAASCLPQGCAWQRIPMAQVEKQAAHPQEGPSTFAPPESNPQRVQEKQQQRQEYRVMREILLLQEAAKNYKLEPEGAIWGLVPGHGVAQ
ncbi:ral-GDS-related protein-like isoform X2 [Diceros bicornis minor]|uniref:ral-GDS-related protein-like isoform X2 n=1 Tax=Diceros bicornis minor TaxID=77932 RepID=UPI0026EB3E1C|nr:ral-GDS-related protein-like isoform X2 [Diceros bicornis minor]XP_058419368.1 ral-GDS-related protein-like isoform X2 [Diceros bicornis minor]XP_058419369.1 ral-GDS-related protein-like isoform X2 [Diceros bicornis minor]XP_058419370.1 ral-GDS-related protein-like isoform X2 [Diceros bicornis minor]XP_058419371.1 ral-GDS-related protein-like isoform X2 [Diceros bicornis minor]